MNKSKFLKKSLAMLLTVLMVVAMIPLGASAAAANLNVTEFTVNNKVGTIGADTLEGTVDSTTSVKIGVKVDPGIVVQIKDKSGNPLTGNTGAATGQSSSNTGSFEVTVADLAATAAVATSGSTTTYTLTAVTSTTAVGDYAGNTKTYTIKITKAASSVSDDATISYVKGIANMVSYDVGKDAITITMPFGNDVKATAGLLDGDTHFVCTSSTAQGVDLSTAVASSASRTATVTAADGTTKKYTVTVVAESGFTSFSLPGQTGDAVFKDATHIEVPMPFGTTYGAGKELIPTFTVGSNIKGVKLGNPGTTAVTSGTTKVEFTAGTESSAVIGTATLSLTLQDNSEVAVTVKAKNPAKNPAKVLSSIKVATSTKTSNETTVAEGATAVSVVMPKGTDFGTTATVTGVASVNAMVSIPTQAGITPVKAGSDGKFTLNSVVISGKQLGIRVAAEDTSKGVTDYTVTLSAAAEAKPDILDMYIKGTLNGESVLYDTKSGNVKIVNYNDGANKTGTIVITVPYALLDEDTQDAFTVGYTAEVGAIVTKDGSTALTLNGQHLKDWLNPTTGAFNAINATTPQEYKVVADDGTLRTYSVTLKTDTTGSTLQRITAAKLVGTDTNSQITEDNTYTATVYQADSANHKTDASGAAIHAIEVSVPASYTTRKMYFQTLTTSEGATTYSATTPTAIKALDPKSETAQEAAVGYIQPSADSLRPDGKVDTGDGKAAKVWVVCERNSVNVSATEVATGDLYYVYVKPRPEETRKEILSVASTLDTKVTATGAGRTINITVPYSYNNVKDVAPTAATNKFSLNFKLSKMATLKVNDTLAVVSDLGSKDTTGRTMFYVSDKQLYMMTSDSASVKVTSALIAAEDGTTTPATISVTVKDAVSEAILKSAKIGKTSGVINTAGKSLTFNLPYGSKLNPVKLDLVASDMAKITVKVGSGAAAAYVATNNYDLNLPTTIYVKSEDGKWTNVYNITAKVSEQFSDIDENAWYYDYVLAATGKGIVKGHDDGTFGPNNSITRQDFAVMTVRALGLDETTLKVDVDPFKDVAKSGYAAGAIKYLVDKQVLNGYEDGTFKPTATITRSEAAKIMATTFGYTGTPTTKFTDDAKLGWAKDYANACKAAGVFDGDEKGNFNGGNKITRAQTAKIMVNATK